MWKSVSQNSCLKGCLIYLAALVVLLVAGAAGLSGLGVKSSPSTQTTSLTISKQPVDTTSNSMQNTPVQPETLPLPTLTPVPQSAPPPVSVDSAPQVQAQGGVITGQASTPFYVVQAGDTLWQIAQSYGVSIESLRSLNKLAGDIIKPGQLLYLPQGSAPPDPAVNPDNQP